MAQQNSAPATPAAQGGSIVPHVNVEKVPSPADLSSGPSKAELAQAAKDAANQPRPVRSIAEIESDMDATRERLAETISQLTEALQPKNIIHRQVETVKGFYVDEYGAVRPDRVAMTAGAVVGLVVVVKVTKKIFS
jgi:hypothetical protein